MAETITHPAARHLAAQRPHGSQSPVMFSDGQLRCLDTLTSIGAIYNIPFFAAPHLSVQPIGSEALSVLLRCELATYDSDQLTALVLAAHRHHVRVSVSAWDPNVEPARAEAIRRSFIDGYDEDLCGAAPDPDDLDLVALEVRLWARSDSGHHLYERHPGVAELADRATALA